MVVQNGHYEISTSHTSLEVINKLYELSIP